MAEKNKNAVELGRRGGHARAKALTPEQRSAIARKAVQAREAKRRERNAREKEREGGTDSGS
jgi:hypothetical protein